MKINPQLKDKVLTELVASESPNFYFDYNDSQTKFGCEPCWIKMILDQFKEQGLIQMSGLLGYSSNITLKAKAFDLSRLGGYVGQEEILKANFEKLDLEINNLYKQLGPDYTDKLAKIFQIASTLMQAVKLFG
ncbi:MAG: hypothetical protein KBT13_05445 [Bacteroidales bacterium]|nr:hypothetical protein [Candidatus Sodaliphilus limicaballi]